MMIRNRERRAVFKICDELGSPNEGACFRSNVRVVLITPPRGCFARGSLGAGSGARVAIINLWPCPGIVVPVVLVVIVVII